MRAHPVDNLLDFEEARPKAETQLAALAAGGVEPFFQPIVSLDDGHILGFEVLARWPNPDQGYIAPDRFIPIADRFGLLDLRRAQKCCPHQLIKQAIRHFR